MTGQDGWLVGHRSCFLGVPDTLFRVLQVMTSESFLTSHLTRQTSQLPVEQVRWKGHHPTLTPLPSC